MPRATYAYRVGIGSEFATRRRLRMPASDASDMNACPRNATMRARLSNFARFDMKNNDSVAFSIKNEAAARVLDAREAKIDDCCAVLFKKWLGARILGVRKAKIDDCCTVLFKNEPGARVLAVPMLQNV